MKLHIVRDPADLQSRELLEQNFLLRHRVFVELEGWEALRRPDGRDVDAFDNADATHLLITDSAGALVGGSRITPLDRPNLLQTVFNGLVHGELPAHPSLGADWTRFYVHPDRREGRRRAPESAALFCAVMEYALSQGLSYITFVSSIYMLEHGTAVGWRITPLGAPVMSDGKPTIAAWIEVSEQALSNVRRVTGISRALMPGDRSPPVTAPGNAGFYVR
ncbi:GNAT family N-acetyltransferase [Devosia sp. XJ19-1]|uniref:Acyl-homoserine-lactone synthase n=1 Tax=Devosia ureilytica TaxID=2952754 RepID=A0A9Q4FU42_9HYPH|nr:acyl-homoserine-lactone synthase [Devosia ureilytica]MCP8885079.1 GNAT family N-acetyltransferase [Devosia ureilytica]MCP8888802.1 GNAT family N-acetyltransferase [Devosia ureilytica]